MSEWKEVKLGDYIQLSTKKVDAECVALERYISTDNLLPNLGGIELAKNLPNQSKYVSFQKGDVLFSNIRTYFKKVWKADFEGGCSNDVLVFKAIDKESIDQEFVYYVISNAAFICYTAFTAKGTKMPRGDKEAIKKYTVLLPNIQEQKEIAKTLSNLDKKITLLRQQNQDLEELAQTLFKRWFVEFEFPNENGEPYKSSGGKMVESDPDGYREGEIPEGWRVSTIGKNIETVGGGTPSTNEPLFWEDGDILWYSPTDLTKENCIFTNGSSKKITRLGLQKSSAKLFPAYSLLMTSRATVGEIAINTHEACTNQGFITLIPNNNLSVYFLFEWLKTKLKTVHNLASGSTFPEISKTDFRNIKVLLATNEIHIKYDNVVRPIFRSIENNTKEIQTLTQLRDTLLPKLMSGELRVEKI